MASAEPLPDSSVPSAPLDVAVAGAPVEVAVETIVEYLASLASSVEVTVRSLGELAGAVGRLNAVVKAHGERLGQLEDRFREHGHIGGDATVGLGSCWDGS